MAEINASTTSTNSYLTYAYATYCQLHKYNTEWSGLPSQICLPYPLLRLLVITLADSSQNSENAKPWHNGVVVESLSDVGMRRANNQDSMATILAESHAGWEKLGHCFLVADGMACACRR